MRNLRKRIISAVADERLRERRVIFEDPRRFARNRPVRKPYLATWAAIKRKYRVKTALDLGCGMAIDVGYLLKLGIDAWGMDGSPKIKKACFHPERFIVMDLRKNIRVRGGVDMIHCREVAEHLPFRYSEILVRNIVRNCRVCYFTAARPGQPGSGHINCQHPEFWIALFLKYGFKVDKKLTRYNSKRHRNYFDRKNGTIFSGRMRPRLKMWGR